MVSEEFAVEKKEIVLEIQNELQNLVSNILMLKKSFRDVQDLGVNIKDAAKAWSNIMKVDTKEENNL
ncbi:hypothetical protein ROZALSC1DRAFT_31012 [Rozella allomycis CSF55]|uniref:DASH complex subunit DAD1 n=1 Tax=Rozella allomycis (strain CSF55) TaxID=988480 RepID=A0A075ATZ2_ROZAC|nr:hypothetical protein O9G_006202 [Rozella allomycis CSF55]RKP17156.1 hypothetical protein ROZALSC1DRAFT_31012 [Rozella allomycis CSF55]|eukprot:EPZ33771.1 hypothetical protein O9G_006202 [Rozella allomycis CSF55]